MAEAIEPQDRERLPAGIAIPSGPAGCAQTSRVDDDAGAVAEDVRLVLAGPGEIATSPVKAVLPDVFRRRMEAFEYRGFKGPSVAMDRCLDHARKLAPFRQPVLVYGETGVGKREMAAAIHRGSQRPGDLVTVECNSIPPELMASHLFGHAKGAFTGAVYKQVGLIESAKDGTLLLDEVENLPLGVQKMLLMLLDSKNANMRFRQVGDHSHKDYKVRLICATNVDLKQMVSDGKFRADLFHRISTLQLHMPPLRERGDAYIDGLIRHLLAEIHHENIAELGFDAPFKIDPALADQMAKYPWPGNVRELYNVICQACINAAGRGVLGAVIQADDLPNGFAEELSEATAQGRESRAVSPESTDPSTMPTYAGMGDAYLRRILELTHGEVAAAAEIAGVKRGVLSVILSRRRIRPADFKPGRSGQKDADDVGSAGRQRTND